MSPSRSCRTSSGRSRYDGRRGQLHPPFTSLRSLQTALETDQIPDRPRRPELHFEDRGGLHRRGQCRHARQDGRLLRDRRPLRTAPALRRDRRDRAQEGRRLLASNMTPIICVGETPRSTRPARPSKVAGQISAALSGRTAERSPASSSPTSPSGRSARGVATPTTPKRCAPLSGTSCTRPRRERGRGGADPVRRFGQRRTTPPS